MVDEAKVIVGTEGEEGGAGLVRMGAVVAVERRGGSQAVCLPEVAELGGELLFEGHEGDII